ncbi:metacaspase CasA [Metarhizium acridum CQMa 102]|uniref:Metacaspase CasA n=1 Tax=Metarhizium acridum (strain CQMa 102) TaxID=655827 RepID=E9E4B0_METAQ|nr:metacaspase CasA [Metarhizium acridum CQMa 102]EFY89327.1 metacaspase CasA [Metarhizium acridum CQMa 102]
MALHLPNSMQATTALHHHNHSLVTLLDPDKALVQVFLTETAGIPPPQQHGAYSPRMSGPPVPPSGLQHFGAGAPQGYSFQYSNCTGRRKALLIGINYFGQRGQLRGCINDVRNMTAYLAEHFGYRREDMVILTDDQQNPMSQPTKQNILRAMHWLVKDARPNDALFFHYSGHGGQTKDLDGDEADGYDEVIYPVDFRQTGHITDDEMHRIMVRPLQAGVRLTAIFDSCHSGTALDLPYIYSTQGILKEPNLAKEAGQGLLGVISSYSQGDLGGVASNIMSFFKKATSGEDAYARTLATKTSPADVIMLSGSKDDQTSWVYLFLFAFPHALQIAAWFPFDGIRMQLAASRSPPPPPPHEATRGD